MKLLKIDRKACEITCIPESLDDLWHLEKIIDKDDIVFGSADRKLKPLHEGEKPLRITLYLELQVTDVHFQEFSACLRINGIILGGKPEEHIELRSHHSLELTVQDKIKIQKKALHAWQLERLKKAEHASAANKLLVVLLDDEVADLAFVNQYALQKKATIKETKHGKRFVQEKSTYFTDILEKIISLTPEKLLLAGPGFVKDNFKKFIEDKKAKGFPTVLTETTNSVGETGFNELISQGKLLSIERELTLAKESETINDFLAKLAKGKAEYGKDIVRKAIELGAVEKLIVAETFLLQNRTETETLLTLAENSGCTIEIISSRNPKEKEIFGMGGIVATLRYKLE